MNIKNKIVTASMIGIAACAMAVPAFAQTSYGTSVNASASVNAPAPTTGGTSASAKAAARAQNLEQRMTNMQDKGGAMIDQRIDALNKLLARVQEMKNVSDAEKASFAASIQTELTDMNTVKSEITADTSTTSLRADIGSITKTYRIYALILPQTSIAAASDRITTIVALMTTLSNKLQDRLSAATGLSNLTALQADLSDLNSKIGDATNQAQAAVSETVSLKPDNGDQTVMASNTAALKDARIKIQAAAKDLTTARKDAQSIINGLKKSGATASTTSSVSTQ